MKKLAAFVLAPLLALSLSACSGGDGASKDEVVKGFTKTMEDYELKEKGLAGLDKEITDQYVNCIVDSSYDSLSPETRDVLAKGAETDISNMKISKEDKKTLEKSAQDQKCINIIVDNIIDKKSDK